MFIRLALLTVNNNKETFREILDIGKEFMDKDFFLILC